MPEIDGSRSSVWRLLLVFLTLLGATTACGPDGRASGAVEVEVAGAGAIEATDDTGRAARLSEPARRVISLLPATTETILALGAGERLVARTDYDEDESLAHLPSVGGGLTPSLEAIVALRPDLVIAWEEAGTSRVRPRLEALGIQVFGVRTQDTTGVFANIERIGHLLGLDARADTVAASLRSTLDSVRVSVAGLPRPDVMYLIGFDPPIVAGPRVFIGEILEVAGGRNVFYDVTAPSPQVSMEEVVRRKPEVMIVPSEGDRETVLERLNRSPGWRDLLADGDVRVEAIPADLLHRPGPSIGEAARRLASAIHGVPAE